MKKSFLFFCVAIILTACDSDKSLIEKYLQNNYPDREIELVGDINVDSAFCPRTQLEDAALEIDNYKIQLDRLLAQNPDSALRLAKDLQKKFADNSAFINLAYPKGKNNAKALMVKCNEEGKGRVITFFKGKDDENIEFSSLDVDELVDSLIVSFDMLKDGIKIIVSDKELNGGQTKEEETKDEAPAESADDKVQCIFSFGEDKIKEAISEYDFKQVKYSLKEYKAKRVLDGQREFWRNQYLIHVHHLFSDNNC